ncbi:Meiosis protein mei2 [Trametes pubescens]|uniref:Meiosis protein mei2 n=1 Tax=Trametes pubescens TaxID=154538 RepID=A0A1M2VP06_TRAPU|nr:Meiosis protein mei2 [Trametes pubescens]
MPFPSPPLINKKRIPHNYGSSPGSPFPPQGPARHRPHLRPLDLASSPSSSSPTIKKDPSSEHLRRPPILLTPPLTPSSSFNSNTNDTPSTPPEPRSPLHWLNASDRERVFAAAHSAYTAGIKNFASVPSTVGGINAGYLTPTSAHSQSMSSDDSSGSASGLGTTPDISSLASDLASAEITPREERTFVLGDQTDGTLKSEIGETSSETPTRLLMVRHVPPTAPSSALLDSFSSLGDVKGILARFQATHGVVILAFHDSRHAARALRHIAGHTYSALDNVRLEAEFVSPARVEKMTAGGDFISELDGSFFVTVEGRAVEPRDVQKMLASFGELASFSASGSDPCDQTFHVDFCDCRDAVHAYRALNNRTIFGARLTLISNKDALDHPARLMQSGARSSSPDAALPRSAEGRTRPRSVSASEGVGTPDAVRRLRKAKESSQDHGRRPSNDLFFDAVGKALDPSSSAPSRPRSISASAEDFVPAATMQPPVNGYIIPGPHYPYAEPHYGYAHPGTVAPIYGTHGTAPYAYPAVYPSNMRMYMGDTGASAKGYWTYAAAQAPQVEYYLPDVSRPPLYPLPMAPTASSRPEPQSRTPELRVNDPPRVSLPFLDDQAHSPSSGERVGELPHCGQRAPGTKNIVDIAAIESGVDTRTTVMIKNIPNKMSDKDLLNFINRVCPRRIDFMYLRMDFQNGCNVGYAFVNFITVQDLLHFARTQLGVKWNMYSSEKVLQMCYATYQGKESLVEKFKNSCIMDEREAWRPKIFFSDGENQGMPEPFPPPTHLRRKERSQNNRGALFVPGTHHQASGGGGLYHHRPHPLRMSGR